MLKNPSHSVDFIRKHLSIHVSQADADDHDDVSISIAIVLCVGRRVIRWRHWHECEMWPPQFVSHQIVVCPHSGSRVRFSWMCCNTAPANTIYLKQHPPQSTVYRMKFLFVKCKCYLSSASAFMFRLQVKHLNTFMTEIFADIYTALRRTHTEYPDPYSKPTHTNTYAPPSNLIILPLPPTNTNKYTHTANAQSQHW